VRAIREGRVITRSHVTSLEGGLARFADPRHPAEPVDAVIFATGFQRRYPMLPEADGRAAEDALLFHIFHRREPGLAFMAEVIGLRGCWPIFVEQGRALAAYFAAEQRSLRRVRAFNARRGVPSPDCKGRLFRLADEFHVDYDIYTRLLRDFVAWLFADEGNPERSPEEFHAATSS
jgi:hypothetical protein